MGAQPARGKAACRASGWAGSLAAELQHHQFHRQEPHFDINKIAVKQGKFAQGLAFLLFSGVPLIREISAHFVEYTLSKGGLKKGKCRIKCSNFRSLGVTA